MTQVPMTLTKKVKVTDQGQMSKIWPKSTKWATSRMLFHLQICTKVQPNKAHSMTQVPMTLGQGQISPKMVKN